MSGCCQRVADAMMRLQSIYPRKAIHGGKFQRLTVGFRVGFAVGLAVCVYLSDSRDGIAAATALHSNPHLLFHLKRSSCERQIVGRLSTRGQVQMLQRAANPAQDFLVKFARQYCSGEASVKELSATATLLRNLNNGAEIYLIGTAHVSLKSAEEVRDMIRLVKPETVMLELCSERLQKLRSSTRNSPGFLKAILSQLGMPGSLQGKLVGAGLSGMYGVLRALGLEPGAEFKAGIEEAEALGARLICGDQDQRITAQKISESLRLSDLLQLMTASTAMPPELQKTMEAFSGRLEDAVEALKTRESARQMSAVIRKVNPGIARALIDERDEIMVDSLRGLNGRVVGVVGLAHLDGMEQRWRRLASPAVAVQ